MSAHHPPPNSIFFPLLPGCALPPPFYTTAAALALTIPGTTAREYRACTFPVLVQCGEHVFPVIMSLGEQFGVLGDDVRRYFEFREAPRLRFAWDRSFGGVVEVVVTEANVSAAVRLARERGSRECRLLVSGGGG